MNEKNDHLKSTVFQLRNISDRITIHIRRKTSLPQKGLQMQRHFHLVSDITVKMPSTLKDIIESASAYSTHIDAKLTLKRHGQSLKICRVHNVQGWLSQRCYY